MAYTFSLAHLTVLGCPPPEMIYIAGMAGYEYASLRPIPMRLPGEPNYDLSTEKELLRQTKQAMKDTGVKIHDIELARILDNVDVGEYEANIAVAAEELGCKHILSSVWTTDKARYMDQFAKLVDIAGKYGMTVNLEFVTWSALYNLDEVMEVLNAQTANNIGLMVDMLHCYRSRVKPEEFDAVPREWFNFVHLNDGPGEIPDRTDTQALIHTGRDARLYPGEGAIDIAGILAHMPEVVCSIELPHTERSKAMGYAEHARRCLASSKKYFAEHKLTLP